MTEKFRSARNIMPCTADEISEALSIADCSVETEVYNFKTIETLAKIGLKEVLGNLNSGHAGGAEFITTKGIELSISGGDAKHLLDCNYSWTVNISGEVSFRDADTL